jgi:hypothetical protein
MLCEPRGNCIARALSASLASSEVAALGKMSLRPFRATGSWHFFVISDVVVPRLAGPAPEASNLHGDLRWIRLPLYRASPRPQDIRM